MVRELRAERHGLTPFWRDLALLCVLKEGGHLFAAYFGETYEEFIDRIAGGKKVDRNWGASDVSGSARGLMSIFFAT